MTTDMVEGVLLREMSHRAANALQIAAAALHLGSRGRSEHLEEALERIEGSAELHNLLANLASTESSAGALIEICQAVRRASGASDRVDLAFTFAEAEVPRRFLAQVGMIVAELVTNSIRHAFQGEGGRINLSVVPRAGGVEVGVEDDGQCSGWRRIHGHGSGIVDDLAAAIGGRLVRSRTPGGSARVILTLPASVAPQDAMEVDAA